MEQRRNNHFVPQSYLKRWASPDGKLWAYRTLVSDPRVPEWKPVSPRGVAYQQQLYARVVGGEETDEIERWLERDFEGPAQAALEKATTDQRMTPSDWRALVRLLAAQDLRTPARMKEMLDRAERTIPQLLSDSINGSIKEMERLKKSGQKRPTHPAVAKNVNDFPFEVKTREQPGSDFVELGATVLVGRKLWLAHVKRLLTNTIDALHEHKWTVVRPPHGMRWVTSDDPVVKLNYSGPDKYDLKGGWARPKGKILLPLDPNHLLFTQIGDRNWPKGTVVDRQLALFFQRILIEHADRMIFASCPEEIVARIRPRTVNREMYRREKEQWDRWAEEQRAAELEFHEQKRLKA